jgi:hypothetical protein
LFVSLSKLKIIDMENKTGTSPVTIDLTDIIVANMDDQTLRLVCAALIVEQNKGCSFGRGAFINEIEELFEYITKAKTII